MTEIDLARAHDFTLGHLRVRPSMLEVTIGDRREIIEPRIMQVLVALARAGGAVVSRDDLIKACWAGKAVSDDTISRCVARLRRLAGTEAGIVIETVPRVGYRLAEIPPPKTSKATQEAARLGHLRRFDITKIGPREILIGAAVFMVSVGGLIYGLMPADKLITPSAATDRVAVLPFEALSGQNDVRAFGDGVTSQIVGVLNANQAQAVSPPDAAALRGPERDDAAEKLGVEFVLDGTVQRTAKGLRVTVHLDRATSHAKLWTASFESAADPIELEAQVAAKAVDEMKAALRAHGTNDSALSAYLSAQEYARATDKDAIQTRHDLMRSVVDRAPHFSLGRSGLAIATAQLIAFADPNEAEALNREARKAAKRALDLDANNGEAYFALALIAPPRQVVERDALFQKGLSVDPDEPTLNSSYAELLADEGRLEKALEFQQRAVMLDPLSPRKTVVLATILADVGRFAEARATIDRATRLWPKDKSVWTQRFTILVNFGYPEEARAMLDDPRELPAAIDAGYLQAARAYVDAINRETPLFASRARTAALAAYVAGRIDAGRAIEILARVGEVNAAYDLASEAYYHPGATPLRTDVLFRPTTAAMRSDKRFRELMQKLGFIGHWAAGLPPPDFCQTEDVPICDEIRRG